MKGCVQPILGAGCHWPTTGVCGTGLSSTAASSSSSNAAAGLPSSHRRCRLWRLHRRCRLWRLHHRRWQLSLRRSCLRRLAALPPPMAALACPRPPMPLSALAPLADRGAAPANSKNHKNMAAMPHKRNPDMISSQCQWPSCSRESYQKQYESLKKHRRDSSCDQGWQCGVKMPVGTSPSYFQG